MFPMASPLLGVGGTGSQNCSCFPVALMTFSPSIQVRLLCQGDITRLRHLCTQHRVLQSTHPWALAWQPLLRLKTLRLPNEDCWWTCTGDPVDVTIKTSLTRWNSIMNIVKKGKLKPRLHDIASKQY